MATQHSRSSESFNSGPVGGSNAVGCFRALRSRGIRTLAWFKVGVLACGRFNGDEPFWGCDQCGARHRAKGNRRCAHRDRNIGVSAAE